MKEVKGSEVKELQFRAISKEGFAFQGYFQGLPRGGWIAVEERMVIARVIGHHQHHNLHTSNIHSESR